MSTFRIAQTSSGQIRPIDARVALVRGRLIALAREHRGELLAKRVASTYADPEAVQGSDTTDWYTDLDGTPEPLNMLSEAVREEVLNEVGALRADLEGLADELEQTRAGVGDARFIRAATRIPDNESYIYVVGGAPVLIGWGHRAAVVGSAPVAAGRWMPSRPPMGDADGIGAAQAAPTVPVSTPVVLAGASIVPLPWLAWLLWLIFLLLLFAIVWLMLSACSAGWPGTTLAERLGLLNRCPGRTAVAMVLVTSEEDRARDLRNRIGEAERVLARDARQCRVDRIREARAGALPPVAPVQPAMDDIDQRIADAGGQSGAFQIILDWDGPADLDVHVDCGNDRIYFGNKRGCSGGELDVDANFNENMENPIENVVWDNIPPPGNYRVEVQNYDNNGDPRTAIPFRVVVRQGDRETVHEGRASPGGILRVTDVQVP